MHLNRTIRLKKIRIKVKKILNAAERVSLLWDRYANCAKMMHELFESS